MVWPLAINWPCFESDLFQFNGHHVPGSLSEPNLRLPVTLPNCY